MADPPSPWPATFPASGESRPTTTAAVLDVYGRCARSRRVRTELAPVLAEAVRDPDPEVRRVAVLSVTDLTEAARLAADDLAALVDRAPPVTWAPGFGEEAPDEAYRFPEVHDHLYWCALRALAGTDDPRRSAAVARSLRAGGLPGMIQLSPDRFPHERELLDAVLVNLDRFRGGGTSSAHHPLTGDGYGPSGVLELARLLGSWGAPAVVAVPRLLDLADRDGHRLVEGIAELGVHADAAAPRLLERVTDPGTPPAARPWFGVALALVTGDHAPLAQVVVEAEGDDVRVVADLVLRRGWVCPERGSTRGPTREGGSPRHRLDPEVLAPALRRAVRGEVPEQGRARTVTLAAAALHRLTGEIGEPLEGVRGALEGAGPTIALFELVGALGPVAVEYADLLRAEDRNHRTRFEAALALARVTGERAALLEATRTRLAVDLPGTWLTEATRVLETGAGALLPRLRELRDADTPFGDPALSFHVIRRDRAALSLVEGAVTALESRTRPPEP